MLCKAVKPEFGWLVVAFFATNGAEDVSVRTSLICLKCDEMGACRHILFASHKLIVSDVCLVFDCF